MEAQILHITNGGALTGYLNELEIEGEIMTWQEMLCEGPTHETIHTNAHITARKSFLKAYYGVDLDLKKVEFALKQLDNANNRYTEIVLWFEYDLFCHINMLAVINLLKQKKINLPLYLVCSGRVKGSKTLKGLGELSSSQLFSHYKNKTKLTNTDIDLAITLWQIYCGKDHNLFKPYIVKPSSFAYLSNCLKAHLERFPNTTNGLNTLETNILCMIRDNAIKSKHHLLGYTLNYQGYYGYGDLQIERIINYLSPLYEVLDNAITLNRLGHDVLLGHHNALRVLDSKMVFGGVSNWDYHFSKAENRLNKAQAYAN